jgi:hypothetical protein
MGSNIIKSNSNITNLLLAKKLNTYMLITDKNAIRYKETAGGDKITS